MASITERNNQYQVRINKSKINISKTFSSKESAELWAFYKETLLDEIEAFEVPFSDLVTFKDAILMKKEDLLSKNNDARTESAFNTLLKDYEIFCEMSIQEISYEMLLKRTIELCHTPVFRGGKQDGTSGIESMPAKATMCRKLKTLSSVYSFLISKGINLDNICLKVCAFIEKEMYKNER